MALYRLNRISKALLAASFCTVSACHLRYQLSYWCITSNRGPGLSLGPQAAVFKRSRHLPIFTGRFQPTIFGTSELNFCVRNGNRWNLTVIDTGHSYGLATCFSLFRRHIPSKLNIELLANEVHLGKWGQALDLLVHAC